MALLKSLPLFPLGLVLYPGERLPLHIFEERYKDLTSYCLEEEDPFGIVLLEDDTMAQTGSTARIERVVNRYADGRMDIVVEGDDRFKIHEVHEDEASYITADVEIIDDPNESIDEDLRERVITQHMKLLELAGRTVRPDLYRNVDRLSFKLAQNAGLEAGQKQELLEISSENERIRYLIQHFRTLIPRVEEEEDVQRKIQSNGHFKDFPPESL